MPISTVRQYPIFPDALSSDREDIRVDDQQAYSARLSTDAIGSPQFNSLSTVRAKAARDAGRLNAASVSDEELRALLNERQELLDKKFDGVISRRESNRLEYVRWSLDRIDDARNGHALDLLEANVEKYEAFLNEIRSYQSRLDAALKKVNSKR